MKLINCFLLAMVFVSCRQSNAIPEDFDYGRIENGVYSNDYFRFDFPVPGGWKIQDKQQTEELRNRGRQLMEETNREFAEKLRPSEVTSATLLTAFKYPTDTVIADFNPSIMLLAENVSAAKNIKTGADYLEQAKSLMLQSKMGFKVTPGFASEKIGNREFHVMESFKNYGGPDDIQQLFYATVDKGFVLATIISFNGEEQEREMKEMVHQLKFRN